MDFQQGIVASLGEVEAPLPQIQRARRTAIAAGVEIVHVRVGFTPKEHAAIPERNKIFSPLVRSGLFAEGSPEAEIHPDATPEAHEHVVTKTRVSALSTTDLDMFLRDRGIDTLILAGVHTSGVVLSTLREAADLDYRLVILADCCADPNPTVHSTLINNVFPSQADVTTVDTLATLLGVTEPSG